MKLSLYEQETILLYNQAEDTAEVYTHDRKLMVKLTRLSQKHPEQVCKKDKHNFTVPKRCVSVREPYSAERSLSPFGKPQNDMGLRSDGTAWPAAPFTMTKIPA